MFLDCCRGGTIGPSELIQSIDILHVTFIFRVSFAVAHVSRCKCLYVCVKVGYKPKGLRAEFGDIDPHRASAQLDCVQWEQLSNYKRRFRDRLCCCSRSVRASCLFCTCLLVCRAIPTIRRKSAIDQMNVWVMPGAVFSLFVFSRCLFSVSTGRSQQQLQQQVCLRLERVGRSKQAKRNKQPRTYPPTTYMLLLHKFN